MRALFDKTHTYERIREERVKAMTTKTLAQRQADYYRRQLSKGLKWVKVWVPASKVKAIKDFAKSLTRKGG